ncbi:Helicase associated domain protein [Streptomyces sp. NBC_01142]|uniref:DEAD/DEAH box helicase n=1 Tax=Streptomyces sp. NBC_01142 TaxID=2975865 RepID=UPI002254A431|nr:DEAD/DEAH box helicase [Streptomyces sp. NBC_01142]MCX4826855.1 Helicase associated domain protein [Streptomyces sp. NBC_01142]
MTGRRRLHSHQVEAVDAAVRALQISSDAEVAEEGLRVQVIAATGAGKSLIAVSVAQELRAGRVLVLVPTLDLLAQMAAVWRESGRGGAMVGVCSLRGDEAVGLRCTTDAGELSAWLEGRERVTVFATYAALGLGVLERAHAQGVGGWDLVVVDEAHRTSGAAGKAWGAVHDNGKVPALRRVYMTATPRLWEVPEADGQQGVGRESARVVASMDDEAIFGPVVYRLSLSDAIDRGIVAPYQVVCVDIEDPQLQAVQLLGGQARTDAVRGARLAALQTAVLKTAAEQRLARLLTFHYRTSEAEAFASGLPAVAKALWASDRELYPEPGTVWAEWLYGEHKPLHRRRVLEEFSSGTTAEGAVIERAVLASVRVLGEGVDTKNCDAVVFADVRGSTVDIVQAVGRALRMQPGEGKTASLVVPVFLGPGEEPDEMLASRAYGELVKVLTALRAHDTEAVEQLAAPQAASRRGPESAAGPGGAVSGPAQGLLTFSTPRDPAALAAFISLRVLKPETQFWRRGLQAALAYRGDHGDLRVPYGHRSPDGFPLGVWIAEQRRAYARGGLEDERVRQLDELGMIWSHRDVAFDEGLAAARAWAREHGHLLAPTDAVWQAYPVGVWLKNQRAAARRADEQRRHRQMAGGEPSAGGGQLSRERRRALDAIDPAWCPAWSVAWQRCFRLARTHHTGGSPLPEESGELVVQGEDLGRWARGQREEWDTLLPAQQWLLREVLGLTPLPQQPAAALRRSRAEMWAASLAAARQYQQREGHLDVPRGHTETVDGIQYALGVFIANNRSRRAKLAPERIEELTDLGMRWS